MHVIERIYTYADIDNLPPDTHEIIDGKRLSMSAAGFLHGLLEARFSKFLDDNLSGQGWASVGEVGIIIQKSPLRLRAADVAYVSKKTSPEQPVKMLEFPPDLVVEILSKDNSPAYVTEKVKDYLDFGIGWIMLVDTETENVTVHGPGGKKPRSYSFSEEFEFMDGLRLRVHDLLK